MVNQQAAYFRPDPTPAEARDEIAPWAEKQFKRIEVSLASLKAEYFRPDPRPAEVRDEVAPWAEQQFRRIEISLASLERRIVALEPAVLNARNTSTKP